MKKTIGYVLSHTHWDREWYLSFQLFRMRLVDMLDTLIPYLEQHPEFPHFHLDGQTVCLEDYLEVRPDQAERLRHLIEAGRIAVGPWYVLPDLQCIGQESILRNLSRGLALAQRFGVGTPVGYLPDIFSHPAQLPQIFAGYGFRAAVIWRGSSDDPEPPYEVLWRAPDGTQLLTLRLPDDRGYLNAFPLADTPEAVSRQFEDWFHERLPRSPSGQLLFMNGCDHQTPNYALPEFIRYFNETHDDYELRQISLTQYLDKLHITPGELTVLCGEQNRTNYSAGRHLNPTLKNTFSTHIPQKIENAQCEAGLVRCAEPLSAMLAAAHLPLGLHYLDTAWKYLLQNHPHDSICGCSCDDVARDMERRFAWARDITQQYQQEAMRRLTAQTDTQQTLADEIPVQLFHLSPVAGGKRHTDVYTAAAGRYAAPRPCYPNSRRTGHSLSDRPPAKRRRDSAPNGSRSKLGRLFACRRAGAASASGGHELDDAILPSVDRSAVAAGASGCSLSDAGKRISAGFHSAERNAGRKKQAQRHSISRG